MYSLQTLHMNDRHAALHATLKKRKQRIFDLEDILQEKALQVGYRRRKLHKLENAGLSSYLFWAVGRLDSAIEAARSALEEASRLRQSAQEDLERCRAERDEAIGAIAIAEVYDALGPLAPEQKVEAEILAGIAAELNIAAAAVRHAHDVLGLILEDLQDGEQGGGVFLPNDGLEMATHLMPLALEAIELVEEKTQLIAQREGEDLVAEVAQLGEDFRVTFSAAAPLTEIGVSVALGMLGAPMLAGGTTAEAEVRNSAVRSQSAVMGAMAALMRVNGALQRQTKENNLAVTALTAR